MGFNQILFEVHGKETETNISKELSQIEKEDSHNHLEQIIILLRPVQIYG